MTSMLTRFKRELIARLYVHGYEHTTLCPENRENLITIEQINKLYGNKTHGRIKINRP